MPRYQLTRSILQQALDRSGVLPTGAKVVLQEGSPDDPVLTVQYEILPTQQYDLDPEATLEEAERYVLDRRDEGVTCPCCGRYVLVYNRKLNKGMALAFFQLVRIHLAENKRAVHAKEVCGPTSNRDFSQLRHWGLMIQLPKTEDQHGRTSGFWVPTPLGIQFGLGKVRVPSHRVHVSGEEATLGWSTTTLTIWEALPFDYEELLGESRLV